MVELVQLLLKSNAANSLIEDYAAFLELRSEESQIVEKILMIQAFLLCRFWTIKLCSICLFFHNCYYGCFCCELPKGLPFVLEYILVCALRGEFNFRITYKLVESKQHF